MPVIAPSLFRGQITDIGLLTVTVTATANCCGNSQRGNNEVCDVSDLSNEEGDVTCATLFSGATENLGCAADCQSFDTSDCAYCGDGVINNSGECDGTKFNGARCESLVLVVGHFPAGAPVVSTFQDALPDTCQVEDPVEVLHESKKATDGEAHG